MSQETKTTESIIKVAENDVLSIVIVGVIAGFVHNYLPDNYLVDLIIGVGLIVLGVGKFGNVLKLLGLYLTSYAISKMIENRSLGA